ncbi:MAG TPA: PDZ domain-containing protein [Phycisphaerae bacterium]|nr:PDZ domain-containing protein [Phycisphaerae bacterium]
MRTSPILTNTSSSFTPGAGLPMVHLSDDSWRSCRVMAYSPESDLCVVKFETGPPLEPTVIADLNAPAPGQDVLVFGQPRAKLQTHAWASIRRLNADHEERMELVGGNIRKGFSGGPVFNRAGELVGVVNAIDVDEEGVAKALPVGRLRRELRYDLNDEGQYPFQLGIGLWSAREPKVIAVTGGSPAQQAGVKLDDVLVRIGDVRIGDSLHYYVALMELSSTDPVDIVVRRDGRELTLTASPAARAALDPVAPVRPGLRARIISGPQGPAFDFDSREPTLTKLVPSIGVDRITGQPAGFTVRFDGYVSVPATGEYTFAIEADQGGKVFIGGHQVAVRDALTGPQGESTPIRMKAGMHPIIVDFFWITGRKTLQVTYEGPNLPRQPIGPKALFTPYTPPAPQE